jgi:hypothetical protein
MVNNGIEEEGMKLSRGGVCLLVAANQERKLHSWDVVVISRAESGTGCVAQGRSINSRESQT